MNRHDATGATKTGPGDRLDLLATRVLDAAFEVHRVLGPGFLESVYEFALSAELTLRGIPFRRQVAIGLSYKGQPVGEGRLDLLVDEALVVELKATEQLAPIHVAQVISYLKVTGLPLGLLINFNVERLHRGIRRVILTPSQNSRGARGVVAVQNPQTLPAFPPPCESLQGARGARGVVAVQNPQTLPAFPPSCEIRK